MADYTLRFLPHYLETFSVQRASMRYHFSRAQRLWPWVSFAFYVIGVIVLAYFAHEIAVASEPLLGAFADFAPLVAMVIVAVAWIYGYCYVIAPRLAARWLRQRAAPSEAVFAMGAHGVTWSGDYSQIRVDWPAIERIYLTPIAVCFLVGPMTYYVPKRAIGGHDAQKALIEAALANLSATARALSEADPQVRRLLSR